MSGVCIMFGWPQSDRAAPPAEIKGGIEFSRAIDWVEKYLLLGRDRRS